MGSACCGGKSQAILPSSRPDIYKSNTPLKTVPPKIENPSTRREYSIMRRFGKVFITTTDPMSLIYGYENEPLLPLGEALKHFDGKIDHLSDKIQEAIAKCHQPSEHHLTRDESAAIYIYTMKWEPTCLYDQLQAAWNSEDPSKLEPWFKYLKLFKTALDKLPDVDTEIWQGTPFDEKLKEKLNSKSLPLYSSMVSCSPSGDAIKGHYQNKTGMKWIAIRYECVHGKLVTGYTANKSKEVIVWPDMKLGVAKSVVADTNGSLVYHLVGQSGE
jgi:hypothetical protein